MSETKKVLFVNSEIFPYLPETAISTVGRFLPQGIQERGKEIRSFMPRYGLVNERRNQLHEVIRLSGMNIIINDIDRPLIIKVASIPAARMQVYFIDNEDYFHRKALYTDADGNFFEDNDERAMFFAHGVLETVKKLRWKPDIIHCQGWMSYILPLYLKKLHRQDPIFADSKVVLSIYDDINDITFSGDFCKKLVGQKIKAADVACMDGCSGTDLAKLAIHYADGIIRGCGQLDPSIEACIEQNRLPVITSSEIGADKTAYIDEYNNFYDQILAQDDHAGE